MIEIKFNEREVRKAIARLEKETKSLKPTFQEIGEQLLVSTKRCFHTKTAPDGSDWALNKSSTITRKGRNDPLIGESDRLSNEINYEATDHDLSIGSVMEYAATQQFGAKKGDFGKKRGHAIPWEDIPARPFLGLSEDDKHDLIDISQREFKSRPSLKRLRRFIGLNLPNTCNERPFVASDSVIKLYKDISDTLANRF